MRPTQAIQPLLTWLSRYGLLVLAGLGALLLAVAEFSTLYEVVAITAVVPGGSSTAGANHGYALLLIALVTLFMAWGAVVGGSRPAAFALVLLGAAALFVTLVIDLPDVTDEGLLAETYESAKASPRAGFFLEAIGSVLVLMAGVGALVLGVAARTPGARPERRPRRPVASDDPAPSTDPAPSADAAPSTDPAPSAPRAPSGPAELRS